MIVFIQEMFLRVNEDACEIQNNNREIHKREILKVKIGKLQMIIDLRLLVMHERDIAWKISDDTIGDS